jgi:hypothetical protein
MDSNEEVLAATNDQSKIQKSTKNVNINEAHSIFGLFLKELPDKLHKRSDGI